MFKFLFNLGWAASFTLLTLSNNSSAFAQTVTFSHVNDAVPGRCYNPAKTAPNPLNPNQLKIGIHVGINPQTLQNAACIALDDGPVMTIDTISFLASAPTGYYISRVIFTQSGSTSGSRGGAGFRGASWVVDDDALRVPTTSTGWVATVDLRGQFKTVVPIAITTFLAAAGDRLRSGSATATNPRVTVRLAPLGRANQ